MVSRKGLDLMKESVENRLLCCNVRKVQPLTKHLDGLDAWVTGLRRDQWATRTNIRKVEIDHDHGAIVKLNPLAEWTKREVWAYLGENDVPVHGLYAQGYTSIGCAPCTRAIGEGEDDRAGRWWWETNAPKECGMHCSIEHGGFEHELHAILGKDAHAVIALRGDAAEVALGEAQAVLALVQDGERRGRLADLVAAVQDGELGDDEAQALEELIELGLSSGRIRGIYGPEGEQAALKTFRRLPGGRALSDSAARGDRGARRARGQDARAGEGAVDRPRLVPRHARRRRARALRPPRPRRRARALGRCLSAALRRLPRPDGARCLVVGAARWPTRRSTASRACGRRRASSPTSTSRRMLDDVWLVVVATSRDGERVFADASERRIFCNVADVPELCSFILPGAAPARADHGRRLDRRCVARARAVAARPVRRAGRLRARAARGRAARASGRG